eukprot:TRINITY_DN12551_c0_g2_i5.p3 TRINITY_DN12551_c0_g2~~TRINITY_DN12551_c0_g2_i5.p3  ORF type:complete len:115 (-),score=6.29 TRINITY_DN12551_c0_g2_i5:706-1050(-)
MKQLSQSFRVGRTVVNWATTEATRGHYNFSAYDALLDELSASSTRNEVLDSVGIQSPFVRDYYQLLATSSCRNAYDNARRCALATVTWRLWWQLALGLIARVVISFSFRLRQLH